MEIKDNINRIRAFNRFYTQKIGLITHRFLKSDYSLVQARILFELNSDSPVFAADICRKFSFSPDYVSKLISKFESMGLVNKTPSSRDSRKQILSLTQRGKAAYAGLKDRSNAHVENIIQGLSPEDVQNLTSAMETIEHILNPDKKSPLITMRSHRPGDMGYVIHRHGILYTREFGFNHEFDAYVARGMADFIKKISPREHLWIAESQGIFAGSVAIISCDETTAQLRWLIVEPKYRKKGIGRQLIDEAVRFSKEKGYSSIILWTIDFLRPARHLYAEAGFTLAETRASHVWGKSLTEECWRLDLTD